MSFAEAKVKYARYGVDVEKHSESGYLMIHKSKMKGRTPYLFG